MTKAKIVGRGVDTLMLNVCYSDSNDKPVKQELAADLQAQLLQMQEEARTLETAIVTLWSFKGFHLYMQPKGSRGQWKWIPTCPLVSLAAPQGMLNLIIAQVGFSAKYLWSCETIYNAFIETLLLLYSKSLASVSKTA